ncbi:MAG TPA: SdpI family protein [Chitinophagaceae bacterium]|nr:SdpI family protein [Chitinophagaceae bacterium]
MKAVLKKIIWLIIASPAVYLALVWNRLPEKVAIHYDLHGKPDQYGSKNELVIMSVVLIVMNALTYLLLTNIYRIDPKKYAVENKDRLQSIAFAVSTFLAAVLFLIIYSGLEGSIEIRMGMIFAGVGLLFAVIGNYMPNMKPNYFAGLRLPWTLENEDNWRKTHRLAGKLFFAGGLIMAVICLFTPPIASIVIFFTGTMIITIIPCVYSYKMYKKQKLSGN